MSHRLSGTAARASTPWRGVARSALLLCTTAALACAAQAQVAVNQILFPSNIGRALSATVTIDYTLTDDAGGVITVALPAQLTASTPAPASGCVLLGGATGSVSCTVPAGAAGDRNILSFDVRGAQVGSFNLAAVSTGPSTGSSASNTGTVRESGEITVAHTRLPAGATIAIGELLQFSFGPRIAAGGDALPSGAVLTITDQLPTGFTATAISSGSAASCSSVASANSTRSIVCSINGPLGLAQLNAIAITVTGSHTSTGSLVNVVSVQAEPSAYFDQDGNNNISNLAYSVGAGQADLEARGDFTQAPVATGSTQTLALVLRNIGPSDLPSGGRISTTIPPGFKVNSLPAGCSGPATGTVLAVATALNCGAGPVHANASQSFVVPLTMPGTAGSGSFVLGTQPPGGYSDPVAPNNTLVLPWQAVPLGSGQAMVTLVNESSADGISWVDSPATPPVVDASNNVMRWRLRISTPAAAPQTTIGTLMLTDALPGVLDVTSPGAPAPSHITPLITVASTVTAGSANGSCPSVAAGSNLLVCSFSTVQPGTSIEVLVTVSRPFFSSALHTNTATLTSPDAVLTGTTVDDAAINSYPRTDLAVTGLQVTPATPRVGQAVQFTLTAQNLGPDQNEVAEFRMLQDLNTSAAGGNVAYGDITASGTGMNCALAATALADEPALPAGAVRLRCANTAPVARYATRSVVVMARVLKPSTLPPGGTAYAGQTSTLRVLAPVGVCEYKTETSTNGLLSSACSDAAASSNNASTITFSVDVPLIDLQQRATRVLPAGQTSFSFGQPLRYRYRVQNNGPSRAEGVTMTARLAVPSGFTLSSPLVQSINGSPAESGYLLDTSKNSSVSCSQSGANADLVCLLNTSAGSNWLDAGGEVNFDVEFTQTGSSTAPVNFGNEALVCGSETGAYELYGLCNRSTTNNNNLAALNDVIFPRTDLSVTKTTVTAMPASINQPVAFDLVVRNNGADATQRIRVQDLLPANLELVTSGLNAPRLTLGSFVTAAPSTATGASLVCTSTPAALSASGQNQTVNCVIDALPGPLGLGAFPGSSNANNTITLRLTAVPKAGFFSGPYLSNLSNTATVQVGLNATGSPLSLDEVPGNNTGTSTLQVANVTLSGRVYNDRNGNGVQDGSSPVQDEGIGGVSITLTGTDSFGNAISRSTTTQGASGATKGNYTFSDLPPGNYTVTQLQPAGWLNGSTAPAVPSAGGSYSPAASANTSVYSSVTLPVGAAATGYDFPEMLPASVISGSVFSDRDRSGTQAASEPGIPGVTLGLYPAGTACPASGALPANPLQTAVTDANGSYAFASAPPNVDYVLCEQQPAGYGDAPPVPATGNTTPGANQINVVALPAAGSPGNTFPERGASISGRVFLDAANDGLFNGSDTGIAGVLLTLTGGSLPPVGPTPATPATPTTATTAADGSYRFDDLPAGTYDVTQAAAQPSALLAGVSTPTLNGQTSAGTVAASGIGITTGTATPVATVPSAVRGIVLPAGGDARAYDFAEILPAQLSGSVYADANDDGLRQPTEGGFANQPVVLTGTDDLGRAVNTTATTDASGNFSVTDLRPGSYTLTQSAQPPGSSNGATTPGSTGGSATPVATVPSAISGIVLVPGASSIGNLFGESRSAPDLVVTHVAAPTPFTELNTGTYTLVVGNAGQLPTSSAVTVTNTVPAGINVVGTPRGNGWVCSVSGQVVSCTSSTPIAAFSTSPNPITVDVVVARNACASFPCTLSSVVSVTGGGEPATSAPQPAELAAPPQCSAPQPTQNVCAVGTPLQQSGGVSGTVWLDVDHDRQLTAPDVRQAGFLVELLLNGQVVRTASTDARGDYVVTGLVPGSGYEVRFKDPATGAYYGRPVSADPSGGNDPSAGGPAGVVAGGSIQNLNIPSGNAVRVNQSLPLDPNGVVYDSSTRQPVSGALVELLGPTGDPVPAQCVLGGVNRITTATTATTTTTASPGAGVVPGGYAFWLANPQPAGCAGDGAYQLRVTPPAGYLNAGRASDGSPSFTSALLPATANLASVPGSCQNFVAGGACAIQTQPAPPSGNTPTPYYFRLPLTPATPAAFIEIVNNHIPLDPFGGTRFVITKQAAARTAELGDTLRYTVTVRHIDGPALPSVRVDDALPAGFRYIPGTFRVGNTLQSDPGGTPGPALRFPLGTLPMGGQISFTYFLRVGVGSQQGDGINTAQAVSTSGAVTLVSNIAKARVLVTAGVFSNEACVVGKVFVDCNNNMVQDREELGIPGVRLFLQDGTGITTDSEGKYSQCGLPPRTHVLKVDPLTLPRGSRLVTSSSRNAGDANSLFLDPKNGELQRADFIEGSCSNTVLEQVKARRAQGEVRAVETEAKGAPALKFEGKAPGYPQQGTDSANQPPVKPRMPASPDSSDRDPPPAPVQPSRPEQNVPVPQLPAASQNTQAK